MPAHPFQNDPRTAVQPPFCIVRAGCCWSIVCVCVCFSQRLDREERERRRAEKQRQKEEEKLKEEVDLYERGLSAR